ncbi:MAG TPA: TonB family protein [Gemmatimonadaceae bacterium]
MLDTLFASQGRPGGSKKSALTSVLVHAAIIAAVVIGTARAVSPPEPKENLEEKIAYVAPKRADPEPIAEAPKTPPKVRVEPKAAPKPVVKKAAPKPAPVAPKPAPVKAAPAPVAPVVIPTTIPKVTVPVAPPGPTAAEVAAKAAAEAAERELAASRARAEAEAAAAAARSRVESESAGELASNASYDEAEVDVAVRPLGGAPVPKYPERLRSAHVEGRVNVRFIVGTNGRVEGGSIKILDSPDPAFSEEVRRVLLSTRYSAAQAGGKKVRQIVEQTFTFKLDG